MAENPAASAETLSVAALTAESADAARRDARRQHPVAGGQAGHATAGLDDGADRFVTEDPTGRHLRHVPAQDVQVGTANRDGIDPNHRVTWLLDDRIGDFRPGSDPRSAAYQSLHGAFPYVNGSSSTLVRSPAIRQGRSALLGGAIAGLPTREKD
ncbi:hypothetical protein Q0Z83_042050 [Actinoplanes sichuanensis]|nr:hypothetical protein Q0Z83_042050 [Actinoplanes sichuanensis]